MTAMHTAPKPIDHLKRNFLSILALGLGLALGYGFGASRSNYAIVYAPAPSVPQDVIDSAATSAAPSLPVAAPQAVQTASAISVPSRPPVAPSSAARAESVASASERKTAETHLSAAPSTPDMAAHERTSAFIAKSGVVGSKPSAPAPAAKPLAEPVQAPEAPVHAVAAETGSIRYGAATRGEIMGRGAGPVYNFGESGGAKGAAGAAAGGSASPATTTSAGGTDGTSAALQTAQTIIDSTQQQIDKAPLTPELRQQLTTSLNASKTSVQQVQAGQPGQ